MSFLPSSSVVATTSSSPTTAKQGSKLNRRPSGSSGIGLFSGKRYATIVTPSCSCSLHLHAELQAADHARGTEARSPSTLRTACRATWRRSRTRAASGSARSCTAARREFATTTRWCGPHISSSSPSFTVRRQNLRDLLLGLLEVALRVAGDEPFAVLPHVARRRGGSSASRSCPAVRATAASRVCPSAGTCIDEVVPQPVAARGDAEPQPEAGRFLVDADGDEVRALQAVDGRAGRRASG